jgi:hypothetical protein
MVREIASARNVDARGTFEIFRLRALELLFALVRIGIPVNYSAIMIFRNYYDAPQERGGFVEKPLISERSGNCKPQMNRFVRQIGLNTVT